MGGGKALAKRLVIDLNACDACEQCAVQCAYFYRPKATDHGVLSLREAATFLLVCRRCEEASCVAACRFNALERQADGVLLRHNLRCVSCKCCCQACPFGTIYPDTVPFYASRCDFCAGFPEREPPCVSSCVKRALTFREVDTAREQDVFVLSDGLAARGPKWEKKDG